MFFRYIWNRKGQALLFVILTVVASVSSASLNLVVPTLFDEAQVGKYDLVIKHFIWLFIGLLIVRLLDYFAGILGIHFTNTIRKDIKRDLFDAVIHRRLPDYADRNTGEYIAEFTNDITIIENKFIVAIKDLVSAMITIVTVGVAIFTIDYRMTLVILFGVAICLVLPVLMTKYTSGRMIRFLMKFDGFVQRLKDLFGAFFTFKNYAVEDKVVGRFADDNREVERLKFDAEFSLVVMNNLVGRLAWMIEIVVLVIGLLGVIGGSLGIGSVFAAYLLAGSIGQPIQSIGNRISMIRSVKSLEDKFEKLGLLEKRIEDDRGEMTSGEGFDITLDGVSLQLKDNLVLDNVSMKFESGKKYLIIGGNGSGKSTTAKLLKNNYSNYRGSVKLGRFELQSPEGIGASRHISYSNETVSLISDSVLNNILLYREVPNERLESAVSMAELGVPLDRTVGDGGRFLSSGERRKLEIARSLIDNPKVMILDEVVSTLDIETAYEIEKLVLSFDDRTVIMISNAFSGQLLDSYDRIFLMRGGRVAASGTHREMLERSEEYRQIYRIRCKDI